MVKRQEAAFQFQVTHQQFAVTVVQGDLNLVKDSSLGYTLLE